MLRDVAYHLHEERIFGLKGSFHELLQTAGITNDLSATLVAREIDAQRDHLQLRLLVRGIQQHLHYLPVET